MWIAITAAAVLSLSVRGHAGPPPLYDGVVLNIGLNCQWQPRCMARQRKAMSDARNFLAKKRPPLWRIHLCNRNAGRTRERVDWVGFNNCIRNADLAPPQRGRRR